VYLPMMGGSLLLVLLIEHFVLRRIPTAPHWLGLERRDIDAVTLIVIKSAPGAPR
jgi:hypothetical protein